ncbi:hypothetical protein ON010_g4747 [Phytophthora cinnamomi]|nr:hypothetical protein ON010_g4747 [Phytophthora cinnamomi]
MGLDSGAELDEQTLYGGDSDLVDERFGDSTSEGELFAWSDTLRKKSSFDSAREMMVVLGSASRKFNANIQALPP